MTRAQTRARARAHRGTARLQEHDGRERAPVDSRLLAAAHGAAPARKLKLEKTHERTIFHTVHVTVTPSSSLLAVFLDVGIRLRRRIRSGLGRVLGREGRGNAPGYTNFNERTKGRHQRGER